jgi:hypothetical protein
VTTSLERSFYVTILDRQKPSQLRVTDGKTTLQLDVE